MESSCCPFHELRLLHCLSKSNRQRQSPRRYENQYRKETYIIHFTASQKDTIYAYKVSTGIDKSHPGHLPLTIFETIIQNVCKIRLVSNTASDKRLLLCLDSLPTHCPLITEKVVWTSQLSARRWLSAYRY